MSPTLLSVGGLDPSGGAGILADLRAARAAGCEALGVLSCLTAQNSRRVAGVAPVPEGWIRAQIRTLEEERRFAAVKTGLFADHRGIREFARWYARSRAGPLVIDPVLATGDGSWEASPRTLRAMVEELLPLATLVTPNRPEAERLARSPAGRGREGLEDLARRIASLGARAVLIKGGHARGAPQDFLWDAGRGRLLPARIRRAGRWHGLGCHLAAAIGAGLATGEPLARAVAMGRALLGEGMRRPRREPSGRLVPSWPRSA
jgi:hydroxymethylpyrimidine/phosphomethylpyrimidine kinase